LRTSHKMKPNASQLRSGGSIVTKLCHAALQHDPDR
jgi:hypothetical protein